MSTNSKDSNIGCLEQEALKRKERLKGLKRKRNDTGAKTEHSHVQVSLVLPKPMFRSYQPEDENLKENTIPEAKPGDVDTEVQEQLIAGKSKVVIEELDITNLAPRKPDWDLKRDVAKKLEKLDRRTQKAIAELIRDRLKERQDDLATLVNMATEDNKKLNEKKTD